MESFLDRLQVCDYLATETHPSYNVVDNDVVSLPFLEADEVECDTFLLCPWEHHMLLHTKALTQLRPHY